MPRAAKRILMFDGAFGTKIQTRQLAEADYAGDSRPRRHQQGNNDILALTRPTCWRHHPRLSRAGVGHRLHQHVLRQPDQPGRLRRGRTWSAKSISPPPGSPAALRRRVSGQDGRPRFVAGAIGPTNKTLSLSPEVKDPGFREIDFDLLKAVYREQTEALLEGGADFILIETIFDTLNAKAASWPRKEAERRAGPRGAADDLDDADRPAGATCPATRSRRSGTRCAMPIR